MFKKDNKIKLFNLKTKSFFVAFFLLCILFSFCAVGCFLNSFQKTNFEKINVDQTESLTDKTFLCEKNKDSLDISNLNYSQEYLDYLSLSEEEKNSIGVIPRTYEIDVESLYTSSSYQSFVNSSNELPEEFSLYYTSVINERFDEENRDNILNYPKNVGNQKKTNLCWTFATLTSLESSLYKQGIVDTSTILNFSELNLAYTSQVITHNKSVIGGGTFDLAYEYLSYGLGPVNEQFNVNHKNESDCFTSYSYADSYAQSEYITNFLGKAKKSGYSALEAYSYPARSSCKTKQEKTDLRNSIKYHIANYGAVTASIYTDSGGSYYISTSPYVFYNPNSSYTANHLITLVGWDDNFTIKSGNTTLTGAYIAQNSWGTNWGDDGFFYIMFDDYYVENCVAGFVYVGNGIENYLTYNNLKGTEDENVFLTVGENSTGYSYNSDLNQKYIVANIFESESVSNQYISRIKVPTVSYTATKFYVRVLDGLTENDISSSNNIQTYLKNNYASSNKIKNKRATGSDIYLFSSQQTGLYTIVLDEQINLTGDYFVVFYEIVSGYMYGTTNVSSTTTSDQFSYLSTNNGLYWSFYNNQKTIVPIIVETKYNLGTIEYLKSDVLKTYDGENAIIPINVTNLENNYMIYYSVDQEDYSYTGVEIKDVISITIYFKIVATFYQDVYDSYEIEIIPRVLTVRPTENQCKTYGEMEAISYKVENKVEGETPKFYGRLIREGGEDAGEYSIVYDSSIFYLIDNGTFKAKNYTFDFINDVKFVINPKVITIVPDYSYKIYGNPDSDFTFTFFGVVNDEKASFSGKLNREEGENVGVYNVVFDSVEPLSLVDKGTFKKTNYTLEIEEDNEAFEIKKREIVVYPTENLKKIFGNIDPIFTYTWNGEASGETAKFYGYLTREGQNIEENVGFYEIICSANDFKLIDNGNFKASNYYYTLTANVLFEITYGELKNCQLESKTFNYDGQSHCLVGKNDVVGNVKVYYSIENNTTLWSESVLTFKDVGNYTIFAKFVCSNYEDKVLQGNLTINKISLIVIPKTNQQKTYDGTLLSNLTFDYSGNVEGEMPSFSGELKYGDNFNCGNYKIIIGTLKLENSETFRAENYNLIFDNSANICFEIVKRNIEITPDSNQGKSYNTLDGDLSFSVVNLVENETPIKMGKLNREAGENVGNYLILRGSTDLGESSNFKLSNYNVLFTSSNIYFEIRKENITLKINDVDCYYGDNAVFSYNVTSGNYKAGDDLNVNYICEVNKNTKKNDSLVDYTIYATAHNENYNITIINGTYNIKYKKYQISFKILSNLINLYDEVEEFSSVSEIFIPDACAVEYKAYIFDGWCIFNESRTSYKIVNPANYVINGETTFEALMREREYNLTFNTLSETQENFVKNYTISSGTVYFDNPLREGYTFKGWFENKDYSGESVNSISSSNICNKTYFAKWEINLYNIKLPESETNKYVIVFEGNKKVKFKDNFSFKVELEKAYSKSDLLVSYNTLSNTEKTYLEKDEKTNIYVINEIKNDINIFVENILINTYEIKFQIDNEVVLNVTKTHGESLTQSEYPSIPQKENFDDVEPTWEETQIESVEKDYVVKAVYTPNIYNITFILNDGNTFNTTVTYGEGISDEVLQNAYNLNMFEYFDYDSSLFGIDKDTIINVEIKSNIYILYIVLACVGGVVAIGIVIFIIKKKSKNKLSWWAYVKNPEDKINGKKQ